MSIFKRMDLTQAENNQPLYILRKKYQLGPVANGHIPHLPLSLIIIIVLMLHGDGDAP